MSEGPSPILEKLLIALLVAATAVLLAGRLAGAGNISLSVWGDRDLWRTLALPEHWPLFGPESNGGARTPGGAFYLLLAAILAFGRNVETASVGVIVLFVTSVVMMGAFFARRVSPLAGAASSAALAGSVVLTSALGVWNPGYLLIFATAATLFGYAFLADGRALHLGLSIAALALGMQIHLQITQVAAGLILAVLLYRPRLTWRHAAAVSLGFALPYLPNIVTGSARLAQTAASLPGDAVAHYVIWEIGKLWPKAQLFAALFGGGAAEFAGRGAWIELPMLAGDLLALLLVAAAALSLALRRRKAFGGGPVGLFVLILLVTAVTALFSDLLPRHLVAAIPAAAALVGLSAERAVVGLCRWGPMGRAGAVVLCGLVALRPLLAGLAWFAQVPFVNDTVAAQREIAATLKPAYYADRDAFEARVAEFRRAGTHGWLINSNQHMSFLYETFPAPGATANRTDCLAIIAKAEAGGDLRKDLAASSSLAGLGAVVGEPAAESAHFVYFPYKTRDGNCLKSFANAYVPTAFEAAHLDASAPAAAKIGEGEALFAVPQPGRGDPIGIDIRRYGASYVAVLQGSLLRGYTGLPVRYSLFAPVLCFAGKEQVIEVRFGNVTIGSPPRATLAPWRSPAFVLPDGGYRAWLIAADAWHPVAIREFLGELAVPAMQPTPPLAAASPPTECLGLDRPATSARDR